MDKKALSLPILISLVIGNMIGTGIYVLPAALAEYGSVSLLAWLYTSVGALLLALTMTLLNKRIDKTGGPYIYCREAFGHLTGFVVCYIYWISNMVSIAGIAVASIGYLGFLFPSLNATNPAYNSHVILAIELATLWVFTGINIIGIHAAGVVQLLLTIMKIAPLLIITLFGFGYVHLDNLTYHASADHSFISSIGSAAAITFWAFIGFESATVPAENTSGYKDISRATVIGTIVTALVYVASTFVLMGMIPTATLQTSQFPFAQAGVIMFGAGAAVIVMACAVISGLGALNGCVLLQGQIVFAGARDGLFPKLFAKLSKKDAPVAGQIFSSLLISIFMFFTLKPTLLKQFNFIALLASVLTLIVYLVTAVAELKFAIRDKKLASQSTWCHYALIISALATLYAIWMLSSFDFRSLAYTAATIILTILAYLLFIRNKAMS
jgi:APA family basic amino acid/polyamine antiporter